MQKLIDGELHTADSIVEKYKRLVYKNAHTLCGGDYHYFEDLLQDGYIGLLRSFERFDSEGEIKFITYAYKFVRGYMMNANRSRGVIHIPSNIKDSTWKIDKHDMWKLSNESIAEALNITEYEVESCRIYMEMKQVLSMDVTTEDESDIYDSYNYEEDFTGTEAMYYLGKLNDREKKIVFGLIAGYNQREISEQIGVTKARVGQLIKKIQLSVQARIVNENFNLEG